MIANGQRSSLCGVSINELQNWLQFQNHETSTLRSTRHRRLRWRATLQPTDNKVKGQVLGTRVVVDSTEDEENSMLCKGVI